MTTKRLSIFFSLLAALTLVGAGANDLFAQGKGKGNGGGKHGGGGPPHGGGGGKHGGPPAGFPGGGGHPVRGNRKHGGFVQQAPYQPRIVYQGNPGRGRGTEKRAARQMIVVQPRQQVYVQQHPNVYYQPQMRGNGKGKHKKAEQQWQQQFPMWGGYKNRGQERKAEVHQRNAERKAYKQEQKEARRYAQGAPQYYPQAQPRYYEEEARRRYYEEQQRRARQYEQQQYVQRQDVQPQYVQPQYVQPQYVQPQYVAPQAYQPYYTQPYDFYSGLYYQQYDNDPDYSGIYGDSDRDFDGADILRTIIFTVLGGGDLDNLGGLTSSGLFGQQDPYYDTQHASNGSGYSYLPASTYNGYEPSFDGGGLETLPLQLLANNGSEGGDLFKEIFSQLLAVGYEQGYQRGMTARRMRESEGAFYAPYAYDNEMYDPYSTSLGDNRRFLSGGYELGFEDALNNVQGVEQFKNGDIDLVSILIGAVSQLS